MIIGVIHLVIVKEVALMKDAPILEQGSTIVFGLLIVIVAAFNILST
jgi:hypothetical protein